jgi:NitT/TauT family transport system substrate-binding protein
MAKPGLEQAAEGVHEKLQTFLPADHGLKLYCNGIGVREDFLAKHPDVVKRFVRAALKGWQFSFAHPGKAAADEIKYVPSLKPDIIKAELEVVRALAVTPDVEAHGLGWFYQAQIKANLDFVVKYIGVKGAPPVATDLYAAGFLPDPPIKQ